VTPDARPAGLDGLCTIVTGAARGIGAEIATLLAEHGARVMLADLDLDGAAEVADGLRGRGCDAEACLVDIAEPAAATRLADHTASRFGAVHALVNNAGIDAPVRSAWEMDEQHWRQLVDVNLSGAWWCTQAVLPALIAQRFGKVVFVSSVAARVGSERYSPAYAAAKAGLLGLTVGLAAQLEPFGVRVNAITPGATGNTGTPMADDERADVLARFPLGLAGPAPTAHAVRYLLDVSGDWVSGAVLNVSGGQLRGI
jgi:NAD(P)-dependent dehydrogenase (short-subunit alcohol dehydrogenase family)